MAVRNLYRQARPFRILGWSLFATALLVLPPSILSRSQLLAGLLLALCGILALDVLRVSVGTCHSNQIFDSRVKALQQVELVVVPLSLIHI